MVMHSNHRMDAIHLWVVGLGPIFDRKFWAYFWGQKSLSVKTPKP